MIGTKSVKKACAVLIALIVAIAMLGFNTEYANAETKTVNIDGFSVTIYGVEDPDSSSVYINGYTGSDTELVLPTGVIYNGKTYHVIGVNDEAFKNNDKLKKVTIPNGYEYIGKEAFYGCDNLSEVVLGSCNGGIYFSGDPNNAFANCPNLKTYRIGSSSNSGDITTELGIGKNSSGQIMSGVTVYTVSGSKFDTYLKAQNAASTGNKVTIKYPADPASAANVTKIIPKSSGTDPKPQPTKGEDGTAYGKGADESVLDAAVTKWKKETDPKGTVYNLLQARLSKATRTSIKLTYKKVKGAKKYVIYGNRCGLTRKLTKLTTTGKTSMTFKKVLKKKVKKGTYYKFMVVAIDKKGKVITTSKIVHATTKGGKNGNDKKVTTKAKKNKVSLKKGKTFKLRAKEVAQSKKLKVKRHRKINYETTNKKIATVSSKGVIKGKKKGKCYVYAYAQNGVFKKIKVTVK